MGTGDMLEMEFAVSEPISGMGKLVVYVLVQTPRRTWKSFVYRGGAFRMERGIRPAAAASAIPSIRLLLLRQRITGTLPRGEYRFMAGVFRKGERITLSDWRSMAICSSEVTITLR